MAYVPWSFPSPDSDYDVRFIYKHELSFYLSLDKQKDTINPAIVVGSTPHDFDLGGWDIQKA